MQDAQEIVDMLHDSINDEVIVEDSDGRKVRVEVSDIHLDNPGDEDDLRGASIHVDLRPIRDIDDLGYEPFAISVMGKSNGWVRPELVCLDPSIDDYDGEYDPDRESYSDVVRVSS